MKRSSGFCLAIAWSLLAAAAGCGDDGSGGAPDARPGGAIDAGPRPDADPDRPDAAPGAPDAAPGAPDAAPLPGGGRFAENIIHQRDSATGDATHGQGTEIVDMDGDGDLDVIAAFSRSDNVYLYLNDGAGTSWTRVTVAPRDTLVGMDAVARDFDGDGDVDIAAISLFQRGQDFTSPGAVVWYENPGGDLMGTWERHDVGALWGPRTLTSADLDGDDRPDLIVGAVRIDSDGRGVHWYRNTGSGAGFAAVQAIDPDLREVASVQVVDIEGDGDTDVVAAGTTDTAELVWYENSGTATPAFTRHVMASGGAFFGVAIGNFDADPGREVLASGSGLAWYDAPADVTQAWAANPVAAFGGAAGVLLAVADLDGDGDTDVAASAHPEAEVRVFLGDGATWDEVEVANGYAASFINIGDIDGDRRYDLVTSTYDHSDGDRLAWWKNME
ncbi:MAG TPA: VCBS repeat-containing protein [Haliangium sp.]|nr:VCBS repeat-containing protein [Haliangium sp.]